MPELRKVKFSSDYWHVVDDEPDNKQIVGSLLYMPDAGHLQWRAEYAPLWGAPEDWAIVYLGSEEAALQWLEDKVKGE